MKKGLVFLLMLLSYISIYAQSFYPIERNKSLFDAKMKSNKVKLCSVNINNNSTNGKPIIELISYNKTGQITKKTVNKEHYTAVTNYKYNRDLKLINEIGVYTSADYFDALSFTFDREELNFVWYRPVRFKKASYALKYDYNETNKLSQEKITTIYDEINESDVYTHIYKYGETGKELLVYEESNHKKVKEFFSINDTLHYNVLDYNGKITEEKIYDINNRIYIYKKYNSSDNYQVPFFMHLKYFGKDYKLLKEETYETLVSGNFSHDYKKSIKKYSYNSQMNISTIIKTDFKGSLIEKTINSYNKKGLLEKQIVFGPNEKLKITKEYYYKYYK